MSRESLHHINDVMSPTGIRDSSGVSVPCLAPDPTHSLFYLSNNTTLWLHEPWTWLSRETGSLGILSPLAGGEERVSVSFLFGTKLLWHTDC